MSYDYRSVRVTKDDLCTHIDELVHEEETALKHLLVDKDATLALGRCNEHHAEKVRRQTWPWSIGDIENRSVKE